MLHSTGTPGSHPLAERGLDLYETPPCALAALLSAVELENPVWEPFAGRGALVLELRARGYQVLGSDITDHGGPLFTPPEYVARNFFLETKAPTGTRLILSNPPFQSVHAAVRHALVLCPRVIFFARLQLLESRRRSDVLDAGSGLFRVFPLKRRTPMMHRDGWDGPRASSSMAFAWFEWRRGFTGLPTVIRVDWQPGGNNQRTPST